MWGPLVRFYLGLPKSTETAFKILDSGLVNTEDLENIEQLRFSKAYLSKLHGIEKNLPELVQEGNSQLQSLCRNEYPPALVIFILVRNGKRVVDVKE